MENRTDIASGWVKGWMGDGHWNMMGQLVENGETEDWERKLESVTSLE